MIWPISGHHSWSTQEVLSFNCLDLLTTASWLHGSKQKYGYFIEHAALSIRSQVMLLYLRNLRAGTGDKWNVDSLAIQERAILNLLLMNNVMSDLFLLCHYHLFYHIVLQSVDRQTDRQTDILIGMMKYVKLNTLRSWVCSTVPVDRHRQTDRHWTVLQTRVSNKFSFTYDIIPNNDISFPLKWQFLGRLVPIISAASLNKWTWLFKCWLPEKWVIQ